MPVETSKLVLTIDANGAVKSAEDLNDVLEDLDESGEKTSKSFLEATNRSIDLSGAYKGLIASAVAYISIDTARHVIETTTEMAKMADQLGLTVEELSRLEYATTSVGVESEFLRDAIADMNEKIGEARVGSGTLNDHLEMTNPLLLEQVKNTRSSADAFRLLLGEMERTTNAQDRTILATELFGEAGKQLVDVAELGADGLQAMADEADRLGVTVSTRTAREMQEFNNDVEVLQMRLLAGARTVVSGMLPALNALSSSFEDSTSNVGLLNFYLENTGVVLGNTINSIVGGLALISGGWKALWESITEGEARESTLTMLDESIDLIGNGVRNLTTWEEYLERQNDDTDESAQELAQTLRDLENTLDGTTDATVRAVDENARLEQSFWDLFYSQNEQLRVLMEINDAQAQLQFAVEQGYISQDRANEMLERFANIASGATAEIDRMNDAFFTLKASVDEEYSRMVEMNEVLAILAHAVEHLGVTQAEADLILQQYTASLNDATDAQADFDESTNDVSESLLRLGGDLLTGVSDQLTSGSADWREYARSAVDAIGRVITEIVILKALEAGASAGSGGAFANGASFNNGSVQAFANGGVVDSPTFFPMPAGKIGLMGEAGAEAIMPLKRDSQGRLGVSSSGGGQIVTVKNEYNIASGTSPETIKELYKFADQRAQATKKEILTDISRGGQFARAVGRRS